jgi:single-stranded-DNA-specific exonuclease
MQGSAGLTTSFSSIQNKWTVAPNQPATAELATRLKVSPLLAQMLLARGLSEPADCHAFLSPTLTSLHEPSSIFGMVRASERLAAAIRDRQKIVVYGDYDVDGITATAILWHAIKLLGGIVDTYIPHRIDEGYGLNPAAVTQLRGYCH